VVDDMSPPLPVTVLCAPPAPEVVMVVCAPPAPLVSVVSVPIPPPALADDRPDEGPLSLPNWKSG